MTFLADEVIAYGKATKIWYSVDLFLIFVL